MRIQSIKEELDLRHWLSDELSPDKPNGLRLEWIEPGRYGSSEGAPDCKITVHRQTISLELKHLYMKSKGIEWKVRPVQRRWHHMGAKFGNRSALLASLDNGTGFIQLLLIRGDRIPLRDYASDPSSGCVNGKAIYDILQGGKTDERGFMTYEIQHLKRLLFTDTYWAGLGGR